MEIFGTTNYLVKKSKKLKNEYGLFPNIPKISMSKQEWGIMRFKFNRHWPAFYFNNWDVESMN